MVEIEQFIGKTISGQKLYELLGEMPLLKFMNDNDSHYGMQYVTGNNLDILSFNGTGKCCKGGLYVTTLKSFPHHYKRYGAYARRVRINPNALVYVEKNKIKCNEIYLDDRILKDDLLKMLFAEYLQYLDNLSKDKMEDFLLSMMTKSFIKMYMKLIDPQFLTQKILFKIINIGGEFIEFINDEMRTPDLLMEAVKSEGYALRFIKDEMRTQDLLMEAVKSNGSALKFINGIVYHQHLYFY